MDKLSIQQHKTAFDAIVQFIRNESGEQVEVWFARELQTVLGYTRWENFIVAIRRAVESCKTQGINVDDHFREVTKMIEAHLCIHDCTISGMSSIRPICVICVLLIQPLIKSGAAFIEHCIYWGRLER